MTASVSLQAITAAPPSSERCTGILGWSQDTKAAAQDSSQAAAALATS